MKNKIQEVYPQALMGDLDSESLFVADFTERTKSERGIEIHAVVPVCPNSSMNMDCLEVKNPQKHTIAYNIFDDHQFKTDEGKDMQHCECCLFPDIEDGKHWVAFVEIKDCKIKNVSNYRDKVKEQIISTVFLFRKKEILDAQKIVYGVVSFPRKRKIAFNDTIFGDPTEYKELYKRHRIHFMPTNSVVVKDEKRLSF